MQFWTIASRTAPLTVLHPCFATTSAGQHPKDAGWASWDDATQQAIRIDAPPDPALDVWNGVEWTASLDALRARRWLTVRKARDVAQDSGCPTPSGRVDTDPESRGKISGSVQMAMIAQAAGAPFEIAWTMQDNSTVVHDASAMIAMGVAVGQHVAACHAEALSRRMLIEEAEDEAGILAVPTEGGWPGAAA